MLVQETLSRPTRKRHGEHQVVAIALEPRFVGTKIPMADSLDLKRCRTCSPSTPGDTRQSKKADKAGDKLPQDATCFSGGRRVDTRGCRRGREEDVNLPYDFGK